VSSFIFVNSVMHSSVVILLFDSYFGKGIGVSIFLESILLMF